MPGARSWATSSPGFRKHPPRLPTSERPVRDRRRDIGQTDGGGAGRPCPGLVNAVDTGIVWLARIIVCATLTALFVVLFLNVVLRYLFDSGLVWSQEVSTLLFPWLVIAGAVLAAQADKHVSVRVLVEALPGGVARLILIGVNVLIVLTAIVVVDAALAILEASHRSRLAVTHIPQSYGYASLIYGYAMLGITALTTGYRQVFAAPAE